MRTLIVFLVIVTFSSNGLAEGQDQTDTIDCAGFAKRENGSWYARETTFALGPMKSITFSNQVIAPRSFSFSGVDLFQVIEKKCAR